MNRISSMGVIILAVALIIAGVFLMTQSSSQPPSDQNQDGLVVCTMDAKICPDGSAVGRVPPSCEFAKCPVTTQTPAEEPETAPIEDDVEEMPVACTMDAKVCWDGSYVGRVAPDCEFAPCPPEQDCPINQYPGSNCDGECNEGQECTQHATSGCYVCASKTFNCAEWGMYSSRDSCFSSCFYPNWCEYSSNGCWQCLEPYDYR
jgi:hypothetical protein